MSENIYKLNSNLPDNEKIQQLNDMIIQLYGMVKQGKFDINELNQIFDDFSGMTRKYKRNILLGNTLDTYGDWTHLKAETGYSIWKIAPEDYVYDSTNAFYFDDELLENRGEADSESATAFDCVFVYDGTSFEDYTSEASVEEGDEFSISEDEDYFLYLGLDTTFSSAKFEWYTRGSGYDLTVEYYDGADWVELTSDINNLSDDTNNFESDGRISWDIPGDWDTVEINSETKYWVRISTVETPTTLAECYYLIPGNSVIALLAMSSTQLYAEEWAWCSFGSSIYTTIRNIGNPSYEGDYYITSSTTATKKQNFFIYNHEFKGDYVDSNY
jgi:hypothetical protein